MPEPLPIACTLAPDELPARLDEIRAIGRLALRTKAIAGPHAVLVFDARAGVHTRLAAIVDAESRCCSFLRLHLTVEPTEITLTIDAPEAAAPVLLELLRAFEPPAP